MIRNFALLLAPSLVALGACSQEAQVPAAQDTGPSEAVGLPAPSSQAAAQTAEPAETETAPLVSATAIPDPIRGKWGLVPADCTSTMGDAKGLLVVSANQLKFYESVARLISVKEAAETRIRGTFNYSGEGQSWTQDVVLDVQDGGKALIRRDYGPDAVPGPLKYARCSA